MLDTNEVRAILENANISREHLIKKRNSRGANRVSTSIDGMLDQVAKLIQVCDTAIHLYEISASGQQ